MFFRRDLKVAVVGSDGMLGPRLLERLVRLSAVRGSGIQAAYGVCHRDLPIDDAQKVYSWFNNPRAVKPDVVVNCAAFADTAACQDPDVYPKAYVVNALGPKYLAETCSELGIRLIHVSTDWVHSEHGAEIPVNAYGVQKLLAEKYVQAAYSGNRDGFLICRTSSLFGHSPAGRTFPHRFLLNCCRKAADTDVGDGQVEVDVVDDVVGFPTSVDFLSRFIVNAAVKRLRGVCEVYQYPWDFCAEPAFWERAVSRAAWAEQIRKDVADSRAGGILPAVMRRVRIRGVHGNPSGIAMPKSLPSKRGIDDLKLLRAFTSCVPIEQPLFVDLAEFVETELAGVEKWITGNLTAEQNIALARWFFL